LAAKRAQKDETEVWRANAPSGCRLIPSPAPPALSTSRSGRQSPQSS
jgi:hypothetical protein